MVKFEVGEVAILRNCSFAEHNGLECMILGAGITEGTYKVEIPDSPYKLVWLGCEESQLIKKKPPQELSSWDEVQKLTNWNPIKEKVQ